MPDIYCLTEVGKRASRLGLGDSDELKILDYLKNYKTATGDQLDSVGERWMVKKLKDDGLVKELTN